MAAQNPRRWIGGMILGIVILMLVFGQTLLKPHLQGIGYLIYWLICIGLTFLALVHAFLDLHRIRERSREQHRELIETTLGDLPKQAERDSREH